MEISIKYVQKFDQELYKKLIEENLENEPYFIPSHKLNTEGDTDYKVTRETIRIGAFKNNKLVGLLHGAAISKSIICMDIAVVGKNCRKQGVYSRMLEMFLDKTKHYDECIRRCLGTNCSIKSCIWPTRRWCRYRPSFNINLQS